MTSGKSILAARANGAFSRGPKTPEGKARSAQNALRHGLLSRCILLRHENRETFQALFDCYVERFGPLDEIEMGLIEEMVAAYWRLRRAMTIETHMMDVDMDARATGSELDRLTASFGDLSGSPKLNVLHRYQTRLHLMHSRAFRDLAIMRQRLPPQITPVPNEPNDSAPPLSDSPSACPGDPTPPAEPQGSPVPNEPKKSFISTTTSGIAPCHEPAASSPPAAASPYSRSSDQSELK